MGRITIEIETNEFLNLNPENGNEMDLKIKIVNKLKELMIASDVSDYYITHNKNQIIKVKLKSKKSDQ